eukprot:366202-Chlamydomonas_euryale.AAC.6
MTTARHSVICCALWCRWPPCTATPEVWSAVYRKAGSADSIVLIFSHDPTGCNSLRAVNFLGLHRSGGGGDGCVHKHGPHAAGHARQRLDSV